MHPVSITQAFLLGLLAAAPFAFGAPVEGGGLARREIGMRDVPPPDEFGSWERRDVPPPDEFGSWEKREAGLEVRHHTEAQIAAKNAAAGKSCSNKRSPHHTEAQIAAKKAAAAAAAGSDSNDTDC